MKIAFKNQDKFRFTEKGHIHEIRQDNGLWEVRPGCSTIAGLFDDKGWMGWWAAGQALAPLGWVKLEKDRSNEEEVIEAANKGCIKSSEYSDDPKAYAAFLDRCYRAHAKETKDTAEAGTEIHKWLEVYINTRIEGLPALGIASAIPDDKFKIQINKFLAWEQENEVEWLASEVQVGSLMFQYCGILDYLAKIKGRVTLGDFKTSKVFKTQWIPQLVGLKQCCEEMGVKIDDIASTRLSREGEFEHKVIPVDHETELLAFLKAKDFYRARNLFKARFK